MQHRRRVRVPARAVELQATVAKDGGWTVRTKASQDGCDSIRGAGVRGGDDGGDWEQIVPWRRRRTSWMPGKNRWFHGVRMMHGDQ